MANQAKDLSTVKVASPKGARPSLQQLCGKIVKSRTMRTLFAPTRLPLMLSTAVTGTALALSTPLTAETLSTISYIYLAGMALETRQAYHEAKHTSAEGQDGHVLRTVVSLPAAFVTAFMGSLMAGPVPTLASQENMLLTLFAASGASLLGRVGAFRNGEDLAELDHKIAEDKSNFTGRTIAWARDLLSVRQNKLKPLEASDLSAEEQAATLESMQAQLAKLQTALDGKNAEVLRLSQENESLTKQDRARSVSPHKALQNKLS